MVSPNNDRELLDWIGQLLSADATVDQDEAALQKLLAEGAAGSFTPDELRRILAKAQGQIPARVPRSASSANRAAATIAFPPRPLRARLAWAAAAACLLLAAGWLIWLASRPGAGGSGVTPEQPPQTQTPPPTPTEYALLGKQALLRVLTPTTTRLKVPNPAAGEAHLEAGTIYLEMTPHSGAEAEIHTPLGKIAAADARCYVHYPSNCAAGAAGCVAVLVLDGQVQATNPQGYEMAEAGELLLLTADQAPNRHAPAQFAPADQEWRRAQELLHLLQNPMTFDELELDELQRKILARPPQGEELRAVKLLEQLVSLAEVERRKEVGEFFDQQARQLTAVLEAEQASQLKFIHLQHAGFAALLWPEVSAKLRLSNSQKTQIRNQLEKHDKAKQSFFVHADGNFVDLSKALDKVEQEQSKAIMKVLKFDQQNEWRKVRGEPVDGKKMWPYSATFRNFGFPMFNSFARTEEQFWDVWLMHTAKRTKMTPEQMARARKLLQEARKEAADYRRERQEDFKDLAAEPLKMLKSKKFDKQSWQALQDKAEALSQPISDIGKNWKADVLELLTPQQRKNLQQSSLQRPNPVFGAPVFGSPVFGSPVFGVPVMKKGRR